MRVAIVCDVLGEENNGTTIAAMNLIRSLREKGHTVTVVCPDENRRGQEGFLVTGTLPLIPALEEYVRKNGVVLARRDTELIESAVAQADVTHVLLPFMLGRQAALAARKLGKPLTASFHCQAENITNHVFLMNAPLANREVYRVFWNNVYQYCDAVHYPTQFIRETFESSVNHKTNAYVISNGVNARFHRFAAEKPSQYAGRFAVVFTGRYSREKSHKVLIDGAALSRYKDKLQLVFAGDGPLREELRAYAAEKLPIQPDMRFFGRDEMPVILNSADLYVHPAEIEIEAISCLEAISCGLVPVIADSPRSATRFFALDEKNLFRVNDPQSLADRMDDWLSHPEAREKRRQEYLGYARQFDQQTCMDRMEEMLMDAAAKKHTENAE